MRNVALFSPVLATAVAQVQTPLGVARVLVLYIVVKSECDCKAEVCKLDLR
jgi:hypothetical protein